MIFDDDARAFLDTAGGGELSDRRFRLYSVLLLVQNAGMLAVTIFRLAHWLVGIPVIGRYLGILVDRINQFVSGVQLPAEARIGPGFRLAHPHSVVVAQNVEIGRNFCIVGPSTTIGWAELDGGPEGKVVTIGDNVTISAGARVLGPLTIGDNVTVGPNVVLLEDVPSGATVISSARAKVFQLGPDDAAGA